MKVCVIKECLKEMEQLPMKIKDALFEVVKDLNSGISLSMPLSKKMRGMGKSVFELRLKERGDTYRIFYIIKKRDAIYFIHAFQKKSAKTPLKNIEVAKKRIKRLL